MQHLPEGMFPKACRGLGDQAQGPWGNKPARQIVLLCVFEHRRARLGAMLWRRLLSQGIVLEQCSCRHACRCRVKVVETQQPGRTGSNAKVRRLP